jgi:DNA processing protein
MFWVVGSRKVSPYWIKVIDSIIPEVSRIFPIVSGGAAGCDTHAHKACIQAWNVTVVVVWTGIDQTYPVSNEKLFNLAVENGWAILSIFRIWEPWNPYNFPVRNEIVVWLCKWVLVVEAKEKSWSLITAGLCLDLWKDLFSIPWDILSPYYSGTNNLIKNGEAKCVTTYIDILEEYNISVKKQQHKAILTFWDEIEKSLYEEISISSKNIDELSVCLNHLPKQLLIKASLLELKWVIKKDLLWKYELV